MKKFLTGLIHSNWFFVAITGFVIVLPLSEALVSVFAGVVLATALIEDKWTKKWNRLKSRKYILLIPVIFLMYLISGVVTMKYGDSFYDVKKVMFYFVYIIKRVTIFCFSCCF